MGRGSAAEAPFSAILRRTFDAAVGQNETVTGGALQGAALRFDSFYALPAPGGDFVYLYGTLLMKANGRGAGSDLYRLGVGIDLVQLLKALRSN